MSAERRIPVVLITGFLGSGKTTLLNRLLKSPAFARAAVVVNEYGEASVDHLLIGVPRRRMRVVDGGCLCGHVHEEVAATLLDLHDRREASAESAYDTVLIETSGLADPVPILQILGTDKAVARLYELVATVTVVDGVHGCQHLSDHIESLKQAAVADLLVIAKTDLAEAAAVDQLARELARVNGNAGQVRTAYGALDPAVIFEHRHAPTGSSAWRWMGNGPLGPVFPAASDPSVATFVLEYDREITLPGLVLWMNLLAGFRGAGLLRVKGVVNVEGRPYAIHAVQTVISEPVALEAWPDGERRSRLVFITRHMDAGDIRRTFAAFEFEGGRSRRNSVINPANFEKFKQAIAPFRRSASSN